MTWPKCQSRRRTAPFWKWFNCYISVTDHPFSMRFGVLTQIVVLKTVTWQSIKICKFKMAGGAILKIVYGYISTIYCAINAKFGMRKHHHVWQGSLDQIPNFENSTWLKAAILLVYWFMNDPSEFMNVHSFRPASCNEWRNYSRLHCFVYELTKTATAVRSVTLNLANFSEVAK